MDSLINLHNSNKNPLSEWLCIQAGSQVSFQYTKWDKKQSKSSPWERNRQSPTGLDLERRRQQEIAPSFLHLTRRSGIATFSKNSHCLWFPSVFLGTWLQSQEQVGFKLGRIALVLTRICQCFSLSLILIFSWNNGLAI